MINNLVFSGGGIKGFSYIGCLKALEEFNINKNIKAISCTSIGAFFSILMIIGYTFKELNDIFNNINLYDLQNINLLNFKDKFGLDNGSKIIKFLKILFNEKNINENITFLELFNIKKINLVITGTNLSKQKIEYFNYESNPDMQVMTALRITMSIPIIYDYIKYNNDIYIDGGLLDNYPIEYFKNDIDNTVGFLMNDFNEHLDINSFDEYLYSFLFCLLKKVNKVKKKIYKKNTIILKQDFIGFVDFNITNDEKKKLIYLGYNQTKNFLLNKLNDNMTEDKEETNLPSILDFINN